MSRKNQVWPQLSDEVYAELDSMAKKEHRTATKMAAILIENAVNERKRKRKNAKESQVGDNTSECG